MMLSNVDLSENTIRVRCTLPAGHPYQNCFTLGTQSHVRRACGNRMFQFFENSKLSQNTRFSVIFLTNVINLEYGNMHKRWLEFQSCKNLIRFRRAAKVVFCLCEDFWPRLNVNLAAPVTLGVTSINRVNHH